MASPEEDASRVKTALDALDAVSAANLNADSFENYDTAVENLDALHESLTEHPGYSGEAVEDGDA